MLERGKKKRQDLPYSHRQPQGLIQAERRLYVYIHYGHHQRAEDVWKPVSSRSGLLLSNMPRRQRWWGGLSRPDDRGGREREREREREKKEIIAPAIYIYIYYTCATCASRSHGTDVASTSRNTSENKIRSCHIKGLSEERVRRREQEEPSECRDVVRGQIKVLVRAKGRAPRRQRGECNPSQMHAGELQAALTIKSWRSGRGRRAWAHTLARMMRALPSPRWRLQAYTRSRAQGETERSNVHGVWSALVSSFLFFPPLVLVCFFLPFSPPQATTRP